MGYTHVVMRRDRTTGLWLAGQSIPEGLARGPEFGDSRIWEVSAETPRAYVSALLGFHPREYDGTATWRWMAQTGALTIVATGEPVDAVLELEMKSFPGDRRVEWSLNGRRLGEVEVAAEWRRYDLHLGPLAAGETTLTFVSHAPAVVADDILHNQDPRALALAVGSWRIEDVASR